MIIDQLPFLSGDAQTTDEFPIERGTTTYKVTLDRLLAALPKDATPTEDSTNVVESGGVYDALQTKQNTLTFDSAPTQGSSNPVTSGGVYTAIENATPEGFVSYAEAQTLTTAQQKQARDNIGADWVLLWQNANISADFPAQTVALDLTDYDSVAIIAQNNDFGSYFPISIIRKGANGYIATNRTWTQGGAIQQRFYQFVSNGIAFQESRQLQFGVPSTISYQTGNTWCKPHYIYGIKEGM